MTIWVRAIEDFIHIPLNPIFPTTNGMLYSGSLHKVWHDLPCLPGGGEDLLFSSWLVKKAGAIPLKVFHTPTIHKMKRPHEYDDFIHYRPVSEANNERIIAEMWDDPMWRYTQKHKQTIRRGVKDGEFYRYKQPKKSFKFMYGLRKQFPELVRKRVEDETYERVHS